MAESLPYDAVVAQLNNLGLKIRPDTSTISGNCFFDAVDDQLRMHGASIPDLRLKACNYIKSQTIVSVDRQILVNTLIP